jgi:hypothetical protein
LAQARIGKLLAQLLPQAAHGAELGQHTQSSPAQVTHEAAHARALGPDHRAFKRGIELACGLAKIPKTPGLVAAGPSGNGGFAFQRIGRQIQLAAIGPEVPRQNRQGLDAHLIFQPGADAAQQGIEHPAHGEHGGAAVDGHAMDFAAVHLAAGRAR